MTLRTRTDIASAGVESLPGAKSSGGGAGVSPSLWSEWRSDARLYASLRYPRGSGALRRWLLWFHSPGLFTLALHRANYRSRIAAQQGGSVWTSMPVKVLLMLGRVVRTVWAKSDVNEITLIESGVYLSDQGFLILGPRRIGSGTVIHHRVLVGVQAGAGSNSRPSIDENVWIGPDCVIYGDVRLGPGVTVLPGTVLSMNVPANCVVGGNPGTIVGRNFDNTAMRKTLATTVSRDSIVSQ